jgi:hypothetical protein
MSKTAETVSSVVFARFTTNDPLPVAKIGTVVNHIHDLGFAQQIISRVHQVDDIINPYVYSLGYNDVSGNPMVGSTVVDGQALVAATHQAAIENLVGGDSSGNGIGNVANADQINWDKASADLSGVFQGRHCLQMADFLNTFYSSGSTTVNPNLDALDAAKVIDKNNQTGNGPIGWFGVNAALTGQQKTTATGTGSFAVGDAAKEAMGVCLTDLNSTMISNTGFNIQTQVMTNILSDLGIKVEEENVDGNAADKLDSVSYLRLSNYLGKHNTLKAVVEDSNVNSGDSMSRNQLFYELAKQYDVNNKIHSSATKSSRLSDLAKAMGSNHCLTNLVKTQVDLATSSGTAAAQDELEKKFTDLTQYESGRVAIAFLYKSQTQGVRDTEVRVHMKVCGGIVGKAGFPLHLEGPGSYNSTTNVYSVAKSAATGTGGIPTTEVSDLGATHITLKATETVGRTFAQTCVVHPLMVSGAPLGVLYV